MSVGLFLYSVQGVLCITNLLTTLVLWLSMIFGRNYMEILMVLQRLGLLIPKAEICHGYLVPAQSTVPRSFMVQKSA
ncbi:hypothetical protein COCNU_06G007440 [Cocos nucifera]|uniref:Uncharacterized protein n=1 Tax=Cocos nucifera TaxID=13894 RepID=A0A8K0N2U1_COCNU|nr:hypothetical protein COCNU_06G007440 [Cocos nucifera]